MSLNVANDNQGPTRFVVRTSLDNFASDAATPFTLAPGGQGPSLYNFNFSQQGPFTSPIEFRMYGYAAAMSNSHLWLESTATTPNAISLTGSVTPVPEPPAVLAVGAVALGLLGLARRARRAPAA